MISDAHIVNVASVKQLSLFRYPGGKTWLVPTINAWLREYTNCKLRMVDPFVGGGSIPLGALCEGVVKSIVIGELDASVSAVWKCLLSDESESLQQRILEFEMTRQNLINELSNEPTTLVDIAFHTILKNRTFHGGIMAAGASMMKVGENGNGVASRWYAETLVKRARLLYALRTKIKFVHGDAFALIDKYSKQNDLVFFIDPPYTAGNGKRAGKRLYSHNELDHEALFSSLSKVNSHVLMTYDDSEDVIELARRNGFYFSRVPMKNTHHEKKFELLISNFKINRLAKAS